MILVRFNGGLGNQLFQYATGRALALIHGRPLRFDISGYAASVPDARAGIRLFGLDAFRVDGQVASPDELKEFEIYRAAGMRARLARLTNSLLPLDRRRYLIEHREHYWRFQPSILKSPLASRVCVVGYWQTPKYFEAIDSVIREDLVLSRPLQPESVRLLSLIADGDSVAVHVRHSDNVADPAARGLGLLPLDYYREAASLIAREANPPHFFVFSDDPAWAKAALDLPGPATFVTHNGDERNYEDLHLMAACRHHITGNSTFSWWGAWLGKKDGQRVFAPNRYFLHTKASYQDLYPSGWKLLTVA